MRRILLSVALALLSGCLDFDEQEVRVVFDAEHDRLDAQLVYRGLHSAGKSGWSLFGSAPVTEDVEGTERQLDLLLGGRPIFALFDGMAMFDLIDLRGSDDAAVAALAKLTSVDRGDLFQGEEGRLCAWQHLRIRDVTRVLELFDGILRERLAKESEAREMRKSFGCEDAASVALWDEAIAKPGRFIERLGTELLWHVPASEPAARALAARVEKAPPLEKLMKGDAAVAAEVEPTKKVRREAEGKPTDADWLAATLHAFGVTVRLREGGVDLVLFAAESAPQSLRLRQPPSDEPHYDLAPYLEKRKVVPRTDVDEETLAQSFAEFRRG